MYLEIFLADFAFFWEFRGISRKYLNFAGPRPREISEALFNNTACKHLLQDDFLVTNGVLLMSNNVTKRS